MGLKIFFKRVQLLKTNLFSKYNTVSNYLSLGLYTLKFLGVEGWLKCGGSRLKVESFQKSFHSYLVPYI